MSLKTSITPVLFLMGPTASGKTALAMELHKKLGCELISVDSALVYRGLDIGTAKPSPEELDQAPHYLIDVCDPKNPYSASQFYKDARLLIDEIIARGNIPVLVGGTMLYFRALRDGLADLPTAEPEVREQIVAEAKQTSWQAMHAQLQIFDPVAAARIEPADSQRIQRAIEVYRVSGKTLSQYFEEQSTQLLPYPILNFAIAPSDRQILRDRIAIRFNQMLERGFIKEVENLYKQQGLSADLPAMRSVGYRQVCQYLDGEMDRQQMQEKAITATRQLAKRQMTWLRRWPELHWLESDGTDNFIKIKTIIESNSIHH